MNIHRKLAGVPVWGWMLAAAGAIALGIYFRHRATATNNASNASSGSTFGDATNALAGGATADAPAGLDPGLADLLTNAQSALIDQGNQLNAAAGDVPAPFDGGPTFAAPDGTAASSSSSGFDTPATTNVASSPVGTARRDPAGQTAAIYTTSIGAISPVPGISGRQAAASLGFSPTPVSFAAPVAQRPASSGVLSGSIRPFSPAPAPAPTPRGGLFVKAV